MKKLLLILGLVATTVSSSTVLAMADETQVKGVSETQSVSVKDEVPENGWYYSTRHKEYYYYKDGERQKGWQFIDGSYYYFSGGALPSEQGRMVTGERDLGDETYYFNKSGAMHTGWRKDGRDWEYYGANGAKYYNEWLLYNDEWYHFNRYGSMDTGRITIDYDEYYLNENGTMHTGWRAYYKDGKELKYKYYAPTDMPSSNFGEYSLGEMYKEEWLYDAGQWYYLGADGNMVTGEKHIGDEKYKFYNNGAMFTGWHKSGDEWYYYGSSGRYANEWLYDNGSWYYFDSYGEMVTGSRYIDGTDYYFDSNGVMQ